jgi:hypothetical protein
MLASMVVVHVFNSITASHAWPFAGAAEQDKRRQMEDELRDPKNFLE